MTPQAIASFVLSMTPPVMGKDNKAVWMIEKAAELGMKTAIAQIIGNTTTNKPW